MRNNKVFIDTAIAIITEECCNCGVIFGMTEQFKKEKLRDKSMFYCPNGHPQHYVGESDEAKTKRLEKELQQSKQLREYFQKAYADEAEEHRATQRSLSARKAVNTKLKNRIKQGLCPQCHNHFANLQEHMQSEHPEYGE